MTTAISPPIESHQVHSRRLMRHAEEWLALGDRLQTSEKAWGAVAHYLKVIADRRGWQYESHAESFRVARNLAAAENNPRIRRLFSNAHDLHRNFYTDTIPLDDIATRLDAVKEFLALLHAIEPPDEPDLDELQ